jgi:hypothetical protein
MIKLETSKNTNNESTCTLNVDGKLIRNQQENADTFNKCFLSVAENINAKKNHNNFSINNSLNATPIHYLYKLLRIPFLTLNLNLYQPGESRIYLNLLITLFIHQLDAPYIKNCIVF